MPLGFLIIGIIFLVAAVRGMHRELFAALKSDFTGPNNFIYWGLSLWVIVAIGYFRPLRPLSNVFLALVVIVLLLQNEGFFNKFMAQIKATETPSVSRDRIPTDPVSAIGNVVKGVISRLF